MNPTTIDHRISRLSALCLAILIVCSLANLPGFAAEPVTVKRHADPVVTYRLLRQASARACGQVNRRDLTLMIVWNRCYQDTLDKAVNQFDEPMLLAIHREHTAPVTITKS
jgi:hypothetical protein